MQSDSAGGWGSSGWSTVAGGWGPDSAETRPSSLRQPSFNNGWVSLLNLETADADGQSVDADSWGSANEMANMECNMVLGAQPDQAVDPLQVCAASTGGKAAGGFKWSIVDDC